MKSGAEQFVDCGLKILGPIENAYRFADRSSSGWRTGGNMVSIELEAEHLALLLFMSLSLG
jgi:hypothetical protein